MPEAPARPDATWLAGSRRKWLWRKGHRDRLRAIRAYESRDAAGLPADLWASADAVSGERGRITRRVIHDRVELDLPLALSHKSG